MADVRPFRAVRYAAPSTDLTAPPYDVINEEQAAVLRARDPHNVVHLTLEPNEERAGERYREWLASGVLVDDSEPAFWWLEQGYIDLDDAPRRRTGVVVSLRAEPYATGAVLPHERTHRGPIESRLRLLRAARAQLEPIFLLHEGAPPVTRPSGEPDLEAGESRLWRLPPDPAVGAFFADRELLIADGHHRYETAVAYADEGGGDRLPVVLVSLADEGLEVYPTHRVFTGRADVDAAGEPHDSLDEALAALAASPDHRAAAVLVRPDEVRVVRGEERELDVELVDRFGHEGLAYTPDRAEAVRRVVSGEADCAFLVRSPRLAEVFARARDGRLLPQKTTYFFPKLVSGLLFQPVER